MKRFLLLITILTMGIGIAKAQSPEMFNYQAVARNDQGDVISNQSVGVKISILQGSASGSIVYAEEHSVNTDAQGLVSLMVGDGSATNGTFSDIDWGAGPYFIQVGLDPSGGNSYTTMGTTQLVSVPYAQYADSTASAFSGNYGDLMNTPDLDPFVDSTTAAGWDKDSTDDFSGDYGDLANKPDLSDTASYDDYWMNKADSIYTGHGPVGIGTDSIPSFLTIDASNFSGGDLELRDDNAFLEANATNGNAGIQMSMDGSVEGTIWYDQAGDELVFQNETGSLFLPGIDNKDMLIDNNDRVGINTADPRSRLDVNGAIRVQDTTSMPEPKRVYGNSTPLAYSRINIGGDMEENAYGIESVNNTSTGVYEVTLQNSFHPDVAISLTSFDSSSPEILTYEPTSTGNTIIVHAFDITGTRINTAFSIVVYGNPITGTTKKASTRSKQEIMNEDQ